MAQDYIWHLTDLKKVKKNGYKVFSCFACGGGSSMGYKLAGYEVLGDCEIDPAINAMYVENFHPKYNYLMGVQDFYKPENRPNIPEELFHLDVLDGSPPCSAFSMAGAREKTWGKKKHFREGQAKQILDDLFFEFLHVVELLKPKVVVAENVKGMLLGNAKGYVNMIFKRFNELGYDCQLFLLNAATMGVPQRRERCFFVCRRKDLGLPKIELSFNMKLIPYSEFADVEYKPMNTDTMTYARWCRRKNGDKSIGDTVARTENGKLSGFTSPYLYPNQVPATLTAGGGMIRYDKPGAPSDRDIKIIQTFPQDYNFCGNPVEYVCGMSVPPFMMRGVASAVAEQLLDKLKVKDV